MFVQKAGMHYSTTEEQDDTDWKYHFESTYYIRYNVKKALYALDRLEALAKEAEPDVFVCHVYLDLLLEACGMLRKWFTPVVDEKRMTANRRSQYKKNQNEYGYGDDSYPVMCNVYKIRNFVEHIDERDDRLIEGKTYHGTFNVIYAGMDTSMRDGLSDENKPQNNLLDLETMTYKAFEQTNDGPRIISVNLQDLGKELMRIHQKANQQWNRIELEQRL